MLTPDMARARAHDIVSRARAAGADAADAVLGASASIDVSVRLGALEDVGRSEEEELGLRVFVGRRSASVSTSDLSSDATCHAKCPAAGTSATSTSGSGRNCQNAAAQKAMANA